MTNEEVEKLENEYMANRQAERAALTVLPVDCKLCGKPATIGWYDGWSVLCQHEYECPTCGDRKQSAPMSIVMSDILSQAVDRWNAEHGVQRAGTND